MKTFTNNMVDSIIFLLDLYFSSYIFIAKQTKRAASVAIKFFPAL